MCAKTGSIISLHILTNIGLKQFNHVTLLTSSLLIIFLTSNGVVCSSSKHVLWGIFSIQMCFQIRKHIFIEILMNYDFRNVNELFIDTLYNFVFI